MTNQLASVLLNYLLEQPSVKAAEMINGVTALFKQLFNSSEVHIWSKCYFGENAGVDLFTNTVNMQGTLNEVDHQHRVLSENELEHFYPRLRSLKISPKEVAIHNATVVPEFIIYYDSEDVIAASESDLIASALQKTTTDYAASAKSFIRRQVVYASIKSKDLTSFFYRCIDKIIIPIFDFEAASLFYHDSSTDSLILGASSGIKQQIDHGMKRSDIKYFIDSSKSYTVKSFNQNMTLYEDISVKGPLPKNTFGENVEKVYNRINIPIRIQASEDFKTEQLDPVGVLRAVNINKNVKYQPPTAFQIHLLEYFCELICVLGRRYIRVMSVLHDQERATHGYSTDLATIKLAASTIKRWSDHLLERKDAPLGIQHAISEIKNRTEDILSVQDNMAQQLITVSRHIANAHFLPRPNENEQCLTPYKSVFLRLLAAKKGMSDYYNRRELKITSRSEDRFADDFKDIPPLSITVGSFYLAVRNLTENVIKYTSKDEIPILDISWEQEGGAVRFRFRDYGIGVSRRESGLLGREGFRGMQARQMQLRGNGLGLSVSRDAVAEAGGELWYEAPSDGERGSTFYLRIPKVGI